MENETFAEDNPYLDVNLENNEQYHGLYKTIVPYDSDPNTLQKIIRYWSICTNILLSSLYLVNISAGIFFIVIITKYRALRTRVNMTMLHCVLNLLFFYLAAVTFALDLDYTRTWICALDTLTPIFLSLTFIFAGILSVDWYLSHFKPNYEQTYKKIYIYTLITVYCLGLLKFLATIVFCHAELYHMSHVILFVVYTVAFIVINTVDYYAITQNKLNNHTDATYSLIVSNVIIYSWLWLGIYDLVKKFLPSAPFYTPFHKYFIIFTQIVPDTLAHSNLIAVLYLLGRLNKQFKMAYEAALKTKFRDYGPNELDRNEIDITTQQQVYGDAVQVVYREDRENQANDGFRKTTESTNKT